MPNRVIVPPHAGDRRTAVGLAGVAGEFATDPRPAAEDLDPVVRRGAPWSGEGSPAQTLAWRLQARSLGGLSPDTRRQIRRLHDAFERDPRYTPSPTLDLPPGAVLTREWPGALHRVQVLEDGFAYDGERFDSLSEIARRITGTRWSGPSSSVSRPAPASHDPQASAALRDLHAQVLRGGAGAIVQLAARPARSLRILYQEPGS